MAGLFDWIRGSQPGRRTAPLRLPFRSDWRDILLADAPFYRCLPEDHDRDQLERDVARFIDQTTWVPFDIELDDRMRVVIAAFACLLINRRLDLDLYTRCREIIVRPGVFGDREHAIAPDGSVFEVRDELLGVAWYRGPVVLSWASIEPVTRTLRPNTNVVIHEFAHKIDFLDGYVDGTPPLANASEVADWSDVFTREYERLVNDIQAGRATVLDPYAATDCAEFFAVAAEAFFCRPHRMAKRHPRLYKLLSQFFGHDPTTWREG